MLVIVWSHVWSWNETQVTGKPTCSAREEAKSRGPPDAMLLLMVSQNCPFVSLVFFRGTLCLLVHNPYELQRYVIYIHIYIYIFTTNPSLPKLGHQFDTDWKIVWGPQVVEFAESYAVSSAARTVGPTRLVDTIGQCGFPDQEWASQFCDSWISYNIALHQPAMSWNTYFDPWQVRKGPTLRLMVEI